MDKVYTGKKIVDIHSDSICYSPFHSPFKGSLLKQVVSTGGIRYLLGRGAEVYEILSNGKKVKLDYSNYNKWLDKGEIPKPGYEPIIPSEKTEDDPGNEGDINPGGGDDTKNTNPEIPYEETEKLDIRDGEDTEINKISDPTNDKENVLDTIPDGLTPEEEDKWLEEHI